MIKREKILFFGVFECDYQSFLRSILTMSITDENIAQCEACDCVMDVTMMQPFTNVECPECGTHNRVKVDVGSYVLKKRQGVGGMSLVFGAVDKTLGREVAIKILNESYSMDEKRIAQFEQEAKITAAISHPHVVRVYTVGQAFQRFFISMELVPGDSLEKKMHDNGCLAENDVLRWGGQVCEGLNAANEAGLIHRDIKPGNILLDAEGYVKIVDFGLALVTQGGKAQADEIWATPYYVPPETLDALEEDFRSDIYALGASLYHALTGEPPFDNESRSTTQLKQIKMNLPTLRTCAPWLGDETCAVIDKAMAFNADDRFSSYKEIIDALHHAEMVLKSDGMEPVTSISQEDQGKMNMSRGMLYGIIAVCVLAAGGIIVALSIGNNEKDAGDDGIADNKILGIEGSDDGGAAGRKLSIAIRQGRKALQSKDYNDAADRYAGIVRDIRFSTNSAMWAGLQGSIVNWLDGKPAQAKRSLIMVNRRYQEAKKNNQLVDPTELTNGLVESIPSLLKMERIKAEDIQHVRTEVEGMLIYASALKDWEEGYTVDTLKLLDNVGRFAARQGTELSEEFKIYVSLISDYKSDALVMEQFEKKYYPSNDAEIDARRAKLNTAKSQIKTKGRAVENFEEWLLQLDLHENRLAYERKQAAEIEAKKHASNNEKMQPEDDWDKFYKGLEDDLAASKFVFVSEKLKLRSFKEEQTNKKKEQMIYLCERASGFLGTLSETLSKGVVSSEVKLKDGKVFTRFSGIDSKGIIVKGKEGVRKVLWGEIETSSVIGLHNISVREGDLSQFEKNFRLEQAIAYAWLGGEKGKATSAAGNLIKSNPLFKDRWSECMKYLR
ncbi:MAG: serine/threonine protein kinase [Cryomorphaceae bacterium]